MSMYSLEGGTCAGRSSLPSRRLLRPSSSIRGGDFFGPVLVPVNQILGSVTSDSGAYNVGGGINVLLPKTGFHFYVEARYLHGFTSNTNTTVVPIIFGIRR